MGLLPTNKNYDLRWTFSFCCLKPITKFHYTENNRLDSLEPRSSSESRSEIRDNWQLFIRVESQLSAASPIHINIYPTLQIWKTVKNGTRKCAIILIYKNLILFVLFLHSFRFTTHNWQPTWWCHVNISTTIISIYIIGNCVRHTFLNDPKWTRKEKIHLKMENFPKKMKFWKKWKILKKWMKKI